MLRIIKSIIMMAMMMIILLLIIIIMMTTKLIRIMKMMICDLTFNYEEKCSSRSRVKKLVILWGWFRYLGWETGTGRKTGWSWPGNDFRIAGILCGEFPRIMWSFDVSSLLAFPDKKKSSWGQHGSHLGPVGPRWAPCGPHEPCYQGW